MWYRSNLLARLMNSSPNSERTRLARELHDGLAQELAAFGYRLDQIIGDENQTQQNRTSLRELRNSLSSIINQVRDEIYDLRTDSQKPLVEQLKDQTQNIFSGSEILVEVNGDASVDSAHKYELLRAIRELLLNSKRHANASKVIINLTDHSILISDDGNGGVISKESSYGITGVTERLTQIGAKLAMNSNPSGTTIEITLP